MLHNGKVETMYMTGICFKNEKAWIWKDIIIEVYRPLYFDDVVKVAYEYIQLTEKKASVERCF